MGIFDLHIHSELSRDSDSEIGAILLWSQELGLDGVAITDHSPSDSFKVAKIENRLKAEEKLDKNFIVIYGEEIDTNIGHVLALHQEPFESVRYTTRAFEEVAEIAHENNGCVVAAHPFDPFLRGLGKHSCRREVDAIEAINGANLFTSLAYLTKAYRLLCKNNHRNIGGSDAHTLYGIGSGYTVADASTVEDVLEEVRKGRTQPGVNFYDGFVDSIYQGTRGFKL